MNKTVIRNFAIWARNKLIADASYKAGLMGITKVGIADALSQSTVDVEFYDIGTAEPYAIRGEEIKQRKGLVQIIKQKEKESDYTTAYSSVIEEVAYTWFNRLIAVRFMEVNDYMPSHVRVLSSETGKLEPDLVTTPFDAELDFSDAEKQQIIQLKNDNKLDEAFRLLFIKQCNALHGMLPRLFENTSDYFELLLNVSFVDQDGVVYHLVHDIEEDDFNIEKGGQVEIIGWLYQYYNAELKDETFALLKNNVKVTKERIPSATQLFTPDWIVRYMVENSLGRLWVEGHPNDTLKSGWKYYLDEAEQEAEVRAQLEEIRKEYAKLTPEDIKVIDPCMGSGHILVYAFDVLMQIYESAGYTQRDAARSILENNLFGLDIDERAAQLAYFAVLMKARQYNRRILNDYVRCNVYAIRESNGIDKAVLESLDDAKVIGEKLIDAFVDAKEYGSILNIDITSNGLEILEKKIEEIRCKSSYENMFDAINAEALFNQVVPLMLQAKLMIQKYDAVITNPPYMGFSGMNEKVDTYVKGYYPSSKYDLSTVFMDKCQIMMNNNGFFSMINIPSWMFLTRYEELRKLICETKDIISLLQLGRGIFGSDFGTVMFVIRNSRCCNYMGNYGKLFTVLSNVESPDTKESKFLSRNYSQYVQHQEQFSDIPGHNIAYWCTDKEFDIFKSSPVLEEFASPRQGMATSDNNRFLRLWYEVSKSKLFTECKNREEAQASGRKWFPYNKGGAFRKWYGNVDYTVNWENDGEEVKAFRDEKNRTLSSNMGVAGLPFIFKLNITWSKVTIGKFSVRYLPEGFLFDVSGCSIYSNEEELLYLLGLLNSSVIDELLTVLSQSVNYEVGSIKKLPVLYEKIDKSLVIGNIELAKKDWDLFETSWDFKRHPLV